MDQQVASTLQPLHRAVEDIYASLPPSPSRARAFTALAGRGLATRSDEAFSYVPLSELYALSLACPQRDTDLTGQDIDPFIAEECKHSCLVFIDGIFSLTLSRLSAVEDLQISAAYDAERGSYGSFLQKRLSTLLSEERDPFTLINLSLSVDGAFVFIPKEVAIAAPLQCLFLETGSAMLSTPRLHLALGQRATASVFISQVSLASTSLGLSCPLIDINLDEASVLHMTTTDMQRSEGRSFSSLRAQLRRDATMELCSFRASGGLYRESIYAVLAGQGASATASGLTLAKGFSSCHSHVVMDHRAPHCTSNQLFKAALCGAAKTSFTGKIHVRQIAQKTQAYQLNNNLLLSEGCVARSKPGLEILADDVKASHGATITQLDDEQLFYLSSRGIAAEDARSLMLYGFCRQITQNITLPSLQPALEHALAHLTT